MCRPYNMKFHDKSELINTPSSLNVGVGLFTLSILFPRMHSWGISLLFSIHFLTETNQLLLMGFPLRAILGFNLFKINHYSSFLSKLPGSIMLPRLVVYNNVGLASKASEEIRRECSLLKIVVFDSPTVVWRHSPGNPGEYPHKPYIARIQKLESLCYNLRRW